LANEFEKVNRNRKIYYYNYPTSQKIFIKSTSRKIISSQKIILYFRDK